MTTGARLSYRLGVVRLGVASVVTSTSQTISGLVTILGVSTQTQSGTVRIQSSTSRTQTGTARIQNTATKTQDGTARIQIVATQTQIGTANIQAPAVAKTITGTVNILGLFPVIKPAILSYRLGLTVLGAYSNPAKTKTQLGNVRIQISDTKIQIGNVHVTFKRFQTQSGNIHLLGQTAKTQLGTVNIFPASSTKTQPGNLRIHSASTSRLQFGGVFIHPASSTETQVGNLHVIGAGTRLRTQTGTVNIQAETSSPSAPGSLSSTLSGSCVVLTWTAATDAVAVTSYLIYRAVTGFAFTLLATVSGSTLAYTDCSVGTGSYQYYVQAQNGGGIIGPASGTVTQIVTHTTSQTQSGTVNINGGRAQTISGTVIIVSGTPSLGVRTTQMNTIVQTHRVGSSDGTGNSIRVSQMNAITSIKPDNAEVRVSQMCVIVRVPRMKRFCYGYSGDNFGLG